MNWDSTLNKDVHECVNRHIAITSTLPDDDERKFSLATPKKGRSAYMRVLQVCPSSKRVIQDTDKVFQAMLHVIDRKGCVIKDLNDFNPRDGHRAAAAREGAALKQRRGHRPRKQALDDYNHYPWHDDAKRGVDVKLEFSRQKFDAD